MHIADFFSSLLNTFLLDLYAEHFSSLPSLFCSALPSIFRLCGAYVFSAGHFSPMSGVFLLRRVVLLSCRALFFSVG